MCKDMCLGVFVRGSEQTGGEGVRGEEEGRWKGVMGRWGREAMGIEDRVVCHINGKARCAAMHPNTGCSSS